MQARTELKQIPGYGVVPVDNELVVELAGIIKASRKTYKEIGELSGVHEVTISRYASLETKSPWLTKVMAVAKALGYTLAFVPTLKRKTH